MSSFGRKNGRPIDLAIRWPGWVLRGDLAAGMSASQGAAPSTFWGEDVLALMREGIGAADEWGFFVEFASDKAS